MTPKNEFNGANKEWRQFSTSEELHFGERWALRATIGELTEPKIILRKRIFLLHARTEIVFFK
jgi:hypothetical protein